MKNKSARHKEDNTFKFQPFSERVSNINVDIFHKVEHEYEIQTDADECYLFQSIQKWNVLNLSESYDKFRKDAQPHNIITLPQLLHRKDEVVEVLLKHLRQKDILCLQALLEFVVALAKDLRKEFYPYYPQFFNLLLEILHTKDTDQLEWTFQCLAYIFKFLWRSLIKDISSVFLTLLPLLSDTKPEYINNFAAESFAFVARKVKDKKSFLQLILKVVDNEQDGAAGCGKLFFEVTKGIEGQFHSYAEVFVPFLFESLIDNNSQDVLHEILEHFITNVVSNIHPAKCQVLWTSLINVMTNLINNFQADTDGKNRNLQKLLNLLGQMVESKNGKLLQNPLPVVDLLKIIMKHEFVSEELILTSIKITIVILLSSNIKLPQEQSSTFIRHIIALEKKQVFLYFVEHISDYSAFEALILPAFLKQCVENNLDKESFQVLTKLILKKAPLCMMGRNLSSWRKYAINFVNHNKDMEKILFEYLSLEQNRDHYLCGLICLPHWNVSEMDVVRTKLELNIKQICSELAIDDGDVRKRLFLLNMSVEAALHFDVNLLHLHEQLLSVLLPLANDCRYLLALKTLDLYYSVYQTENIINLDLFKKINVCLETNFSSPYHEVRLSTCHIYTIFEKTLMEDCSVFSLCYKVESTNPQVDTYRALLQILEKLDYDRQQVSLIKDTNFITVPLRYLCGILYINFKLLWDPVSNLITSYANGMSIDVFWNIYYKELKNAASQVRSHAKIENQLFGVDAQFLEDLYRESNELSDKPDFINFRILLWKTMANFPQVAEAKTRDTSEFLLDFIGNEYMKSNTEMASVCNIKQFAPTEAETNDSQIEDEMNISQDNQISNNQENNIENFNKTESGDVSENVAEQPPKNRIKSFAKSGAKVALRSLTEHLKVFAKIKSPKSMFREPELYKLYFDLLSHKNSEVQKIALDCILTYKPKYLVPYQSNLYGLIDDKNFKNELIAFKIDKESNIVQNEHREELMPIVMRIVFSKMFAKIGLRTGGKSSGQFRRTLVLRFLSGCHENEMLTFIQMTFKFYTKHFQDDCEKMVENIANNVNLEEFIPLKRLQSTLNLINVVIEQFGGLMGNDLLKFVMKVTLVIAAFAKGAFDKASDIHSGYSTSLRNIRSSCVKIIERFYQRFESYPWTAQEINSIFKCIVFPTIEKLPIECIHSPTPLLKLLILWGSIPQYFSLLIKHEENNNDKYPLVFIMRLLVNDKCHITVANAIMEMTEKLLSLKSNEEDVNISLPVDNLVPLDNKIADNLQIKEKLNYGSYILLPHISYVLEKIKNKLKNKSRNINQRELFVLSRVSELVSDADISDTILELLLPIILKRCNQYTGEEIVLQYTLTIVHLLKNVKTPEKHLKQISPLFGEVAYPSARKILCDILKNVAERDNNLCVASNLVIELNAWDAKWIDQPDYQRRLDAFKEIQKLIADDSNGIGIELSVILIYNCLYILKIDKDISLKETASYCLKTLVPLIVNNYKSMQEKLNYLLEEILFPVIRWGLKNKNNDYRNECISLLGVLSRECPDAHVVLRDLNKLTNKIDLEVDFFENIVHLQLHRHVRGLFKFVQIFKEESIAPNTRTLTQFILPLTSHYLCNDKYVSKNSMIDAALETFGVVCRLLPWHQYEGVLKYYLSKLRYKVEFQRQLVRLIVTILDAFHYDLKKGFIESNSENKPVNVAEESAKETENDEEERDKEVDEALEAIEEVSEENQNLQDDDEGKSSENPTENGIEEDEPKEIQKPYNKTTLLCKSTACRVIRSIKVVLLPQLHKSLAVLTQHDTSHKVNRKKTAGEREEEDLLKVPISLALVKLLQKLPKKLLEINLPGIFMKLCTFLKSQLESVRRAARETFQKIMLTIGPDYLSILLEEIVPLMTRGFQVHVLVYTVHAVLTSLKEHYKAGHIDKVLLTILDLCKMDLFGSLGEEKEVGKIISKTSEAKSTKSYDTLQIVAQFITEKCLMDLLVPIKNVLVASHSFKVTVKLQDCLRHIALGLIDNEYVELENLLKFSYGVSSELIPELLPEDKTKQNAKEPEKLLTKVEDCMIIPKEPVYKSGYRMNNVKRSSKANAYILIEFGLRLCFLLLKRDRIKELDFVAFMDPFVNIFKNCLNSQHIKLSTTSLNCLCWTLKYELPTLKIHVKEVTELIFGILHKYAAAGLSKGDNFDLVVAAFKAMTVLVRDVKYYTIDVEQLKVLLLYVEQDLYNYEKQATAFGLLKAIISRKLIVPELDGVMQKIAELSIVSEAPHVRLQSRIVFHQYLMDYPLGTKLDDHISFYLKQLSYEMQFGRESALEVIQSLINSFPYNVLKINSPTFLITLGARLINDESPDCKKQISNCLTLMMKKLQKNDLDNLFDIILLWFNDKKINHNSLAAQLCGIVIQIEKSAFEARLPNIVPIILSQFGINSKNRKPGQFVLLKKDDVEATENDENEDTSKLRMKDHHIFLILQMLLKICANCPAFLKDTDQIEVLSKYVQTLLAYPHEWVRLASAQFLGYVLASVDVEQLALLLKENNSKDGIYLHDDPQHSIKALTLDLIAQLQPGTIKSDFAEQVIKNLVFIARVLQRVPINNERIDLLWLTKKMRRIMNTEIVETPNSTILRTEVFKWIAGIATALDLDNIRIILNHLMAPLVREMITIEESNAPLRQLSKQVGNIIKKRIGMDEYADKLSKVQQHLSIKRAERKRNRNQLAVTDPEIYAKKKIKRHEKKKEAKKRKITERKGSDRRIKRKKVVDLEADI